MEDAVWQGLGGTSGVGGRLELSCGVVVLFIIFVYLYIALCMPMCLRIVLDWM